jgi:tetratricopeptide (TPR) repeat protein
MSDEFMRAGTARPGPLAERREALGLTQGELAKLLGVEVSSVVQWEHGGTGVPAAIAPEKAGSRKAKEPDRPRQLPAAVADFTGRAAELDSLTRILDEAGSGTPGTVVISAIGGTAGVGKTALALHWAHQVASRFPDGQLHVNLRGFDPSGVPMPPADAVRGFLDALGVPPGRIPRSADAQAGLYRSLLADRRMLIVLDNARDEQQVRPLLPASPGTLVLVTSRNQITGLAAAEGARVITLDALTRSEAVQMLTSRLGPDRASTEPDAVSEIAALCAGLPLALSVAAARVTARPGFPLAVLAAELRGTAGRLDALDVGDPRASVQAVFSWSYQQLSPQEARMFRLMGLHPGPDISLDAAARLAEADPAEARSRLDELARGCLITEHVPGRYTCHDLLRAYAIRQARTIDGELALTAALGRVLDHYAQAARAAAILLYPSREMIASAAGQPGDSCPEDAQQARAWLEAERPNLTASITLAAESGFDRHAWQLPWFLATHLARRGYWNERVALQRTALAAATRLEDHAGQALSSRLLANAYLDLRDLDQALDCYQASAGLYRQLGNRVGEAKAWQGIAVVAGFQGRFTDSIGYYEYVLRLQQGLGDKAGEARTLLGMGAVRGALGAVPEGRELCRRALTLAAELGNRYIEALAWHGIGYAEQVLGDFAEAAAGFRRALDLARKAGDRFLEADVFTHLGDLHHAHGKTPRAHEAWSRALAIFDQIQHPDAGQVRARVANPGPPGSALSGGSPFIGDPATAAQSPPLPWCSSLGQYLPDIKRPTTDTVQLLRINR